MKKYTTKEVAELLSVNIRTIQRHVATISDELSNINKKGVLISEGVLHLLKWRQDNDKLTTDDDTENKEDFDYVEGFTTEEYIEFQKRINEYPVLKEYIDSLKEQVEFLRFNNVQQNETIRDLSAGFKQRNFIEAKEKGFGDD